MRQVASAGLMLSLLACGVGAGAQTPPPADAAIAAAVDPAASAVVAGGRVPGLAIAVARGGTIVFERAYGLADVARKIPVTTDTRFEIGSVTKQFTAACVMQLVEAKKISLDDHLGTYLSDYFVGRGVTVRQLLEQVSGIPEYLHGDDLPAAAAEPATFATILARVSSKPLEFAPGSRWKYSNTNYAILGRIVEIASHQPYEAYVREHIFAPAGMTQSGFIDDEKTLPTVARGYAAQAKGATLAPPLRAEWAAGAGSIVSTAGDLVKWNVALRSGRIVSAADVALMQTSAVDASGNKTQYGFGFVVDSLDGHARVWHNGGTFGFYALDSTFPADDESIVVLTNSTLPAADALARAAFAASHPDVAQTAAVVTPAPGEDSAITARVRLAFTNFQTGEIDRTKFSDAMSRALRPDTVSELAERIGPLGAPTALVFRGKDVSGTLTIYTYRATFAVIALSIVVVIDGDDKIASYVIRST